MQKWSNCGRKQKRRRDNMKTCELYQEASDDNIPVLLLDIPENGSMCIQADNGQCFIGMDSSMIEDDAIHRVHLAHELGHCKTGAFYNRWAVRDVRQKHEYRADKWAIQKMIPAPELDRAVANGCTTIWELSDHFDVTEDFMRRAVCLYIYGNLSTSLYF